MLSGARRLAARRVAVRARTRFAAPSQRRFAGDSPVKIDPYEVFEDRVGPDSTENEIKEAFRNLVKEYHPDSNPDADPRKIAEVNEAYQILIKQNAKEKVRNKWYQNRGGDEPPVPRSELQDRVYKASETRWEETTQMMLFKIKKRYGTIVYWIAKGTFEIMQLVRAFRVIVIIMIFMGFVGIIKQWYAGKHLEKMRRMRERRGAEDPTLKLTLA